MRRYSIALVLIVFLICQSVAPGDAREDRANRWDCGTLTLYHLLRLETKTHDLSQIKSLFPTTADGEHSFHELRVVASRCGLELDPVVLPMRPSAIDRPTVIFLKRDQEGHFILIRPVGHSGQLVQVFDGTQTPFVCDASTLYDSPSWTGLALIPRRSNHFVLAFALLTLSCGTIVLVRDVMSRSHAD